MRIPAARPNAMAFTARYAEAHVKPVVSDFDTFTVGSRGRVHGVSSSPPRGYIRLEACATASSPRTRRARERRRHGRRLPLRNCLQAQLITWLLQRTQEILGSLDHNPWTSRWLEALFSLAPLSKNPQCARRGVEEGEREGGLLTRALSEGVFRPFRPLSEDGVHPELPKFGFGDPTSCARREDRPCDSVTCNRAAGTSSLLMW